jgi:hypothetical protein
MPKTKISEYDATAANNTDVNSINIAEGCAPSGINNAIRQVMADLKDFQQGTKGDAFLGPVTPSTLTLTGLTANRILYTNASKQVSSSDNVQFDGTTLTVNTLSATSITSVGGSINGMTIGASTASTGNFTTLGATGVATFSAGSVSAPAITTTGDTNTGIYFPAADTIAFSEGGVESMRIDASGNLGIGTSSPSNILHVKKDQTSATYVLAQNDGSTSASTFAGFAILEGSTIKGGIRRVRDGGSSPTQVGTFAADSEPLAFWANGAERMRIDSSGNLLVGTTATISAGKQTISYNGVNNNGIVISESANTSGTSYLVFNQGSTVIGTVARVSTTSAVVYNTTSDERLKSNIADANPVLDKLMNVKVRQFDWTEGNLHQDAGFIAQELALVLSGIVTEGKTEKDMWQLDYSRLTPYLLKAIQEQQAMIEQLTTRLNALEGK